MNKKRFADFVFLITGSAILLIMMIIVTVNFFKDGKIFEKPVIAAAEGTAETPAPESTEGPKTVVVQPEIGNKTQQYTRSYSLYNPTPVPNKATASPSPLVDYGEGIPPGMGKDTTPTPNGTPGSTGTPAAGSPSPGATNGTSPKPAGTSDSPAGSPKPTDTNQGAAGTPQGATGTPQGTAGTPKPAAPSESPAKAEKISVEIINYSGIPNLTEAIRGKLEAEGYEVSAGRDSSLKPVKTEIIERNDKKAGAAVRKTVGYGTVSKQADPNSRFDVTVIIGDDFPK